MGLKSLSFRSSVEGFTRLSNRSRNFKKPTKLNHCRDFFLLASRGSGVWTVLSNLVAITFHLASRSNIIIFENFLLLSDS